MAMEMVRVLPDPEAIKVQYGLTKEFTEKKQKRDEEIAKVFTGESNKFLMIIGPCSADREDAVLEYIHRLARLQEQVADKILIIPRIYTNKPRTTGDGYKGMLHQPDPTKESDMLSGLLAIRHLHTQAFEDTGMTCADEMLYPENYAFLSDVLGYVAIGARSVENQQHRLVASGVEQPIGMKNPTSGDLTVMLNSITAAQHHHTFLYRNAEVHTSGNPLAHAILRGAVDAYGRTQPNYHYEDLSRLYEMYAAKNLKNMALIVDANHSNSGKQYLEQIRISNEVLHSCRHSDNIRSMVKGLMIESYLEDGAQKVEEGVFGRSITDPCLGWEKTEKLMFTIADQL
ncbi:MAG TPA: 3-deoxy-7-phosphoheptulonate synthase [Candidatus Faecivivens stercorigallinarum]|nr:3-deoxy-7-phosphoheptulonate synthase [Candidatus Faecivivens stercorigallinarum]